ncbi:DUF982 domain-containing protein [Phyllobacterium zundukense]|uniref:DUF982 domain-containing protein n=2 Tax=Phyllobacterium zundukense TaxID=1867719 RepID=A0ACD4CYT3_9HYPH|nr:DUF982 domain-containing protein [Phyllobacterium zundukense]UXN57872.1 DUF982 domain-containing protein [Phyllobacterium zundukense]UXN58714.1 DUF982 domain-containing protein [Phyllobacterium zundukense]
MSHPFPPVTIESRRLGKPENICSVTEAAEFLLMKWPVHQGPKLKAARQRCFDALDGNASAADARSAFIEAAKEADIFVDYINQGK